MNEEAHDTSSTSSTNGIVSNRPSLPYAGFFKRFWAGILDLIALYILAMVAVLALIATGDSNDSIDWLAPLAILVTFWLYFACFESSAGGATPGKKASRLRVADPRGEQLRFAQASLRALGKLFVLMTLGLGLLTLLFDRQRRGLDDFVAGTRVFDLEAVVVSGPRPWWRKAVGPLLLVLVIGAMLKVALDAQADFKNRATIAGVMREIRTQLQSPYAEFYTEHGRAPLRSELPFSHPSVRSVEVDTAGALVFHLIDPEVAVVRLSPVIGTDGSMTWTCRAQAEHIHWFPRDCRP